MFSSTLNYVHDNISLNFRPDERRKLRGQKGGGLLYLLLSNRNVMMVFKQRNMLLVHFSIGNLWINKLKVVVTSMCTLCVADYC